MQSIMKNTRLLLAGCLSFSLAFCDLPSGLALPQAHAEGDGIVRISQSGPGTHRRLKLGLNKALVVDLPEDAHDILVSDPEMADAVTRTSRRIYLFGKTVGQTNIFIFGADGQEIVSLDVEIERDITGLQANLRRFIADSDIKIEIVSDNIVLTGTVRTPQDAAQAERLAFAFLKGGEATTRTETATSNGGDGSVALFAEGRQTSQIVNLLKIDGEDQVTLKITVAEVRREVLKQLGFDHSVTNRSGLEVLTLDNAANIASGGIAGSLTTSLGRYTLNSFMNAMEQANAVRTLAEPTLTAISGQSASFNSGGTRYYPVVQTDGTVTYQSFQYGIRLDFTPVVLSAGRISLRINTEVSEPTTTTGATDVRQRQADTSVELPSGGSIVLAGLVRDDVQQGIQGVPIAGKVPVLGALFRSRSLERNETELVIIATPYLVRPVARNQLSRPDDNFAPDNDAATFFLNRVNRIYGQAERPVAVGQYHGAVGFIYK